MQKHACTFVFVTHDVCILICTYFCHMLLMYSRIVLAGIIFGGLLEKERKLQLVDIYKFGGYWFTRYDRHSFSGSLRSWLNIGGFNFGSVAGNPPIRQI